MTSGPSATVAIHERHDSTRVQLSGDLDLATVPAVRAVACEAAGRAAELVADLRHVRYVDSTGLSLLVDLRAACGGRIVTEVCAPAVARIITVTGLAEVLHLHHVAEQETMVQPTW